MVVVGLDTVGGNILAELVVGISAVRSIEVDVLGLLSPVVPLFRLFSTLDHPDDLVPALSRLVRFLKLLSFLSLVVVVTLLVVVLIAVTYDLAPRHSMEYSSCIDASKLVAFIANSVCSLSSGNGVFLFFFFFLAIK